jgi:hypothetical protein
MDNIVQIIVYKRLSKEDDDVIIPSNVHTRRINKEIGIRKLTKGTMKEFKNCSYLHMYRYSDKMRLDKDYI